MNGRSLSAVLWHRRWTALATIVLVGVLTVGWLLLAPRSYTSTALISVTPQQQLASEPATTHDLQATIAQLTGSVPVLLDARDRVTRAAPASPRRSVAQLQTEVTGALLPSTVLIRIIVTDRDARYARDLANAIADVVPLHDPSGGSFVFADAGRATTPTGFAEPEIAPALWWGAAAAVLLALGAAFARERLGGSIDDRAQLAKVGALPVLGAVTVPADRGLDDAERLRSTRVALEFATSDEPTHTVVVAPATRDEVPGWVAVNLAAALAQVEHRVLVVDADFTAPASQRHPALRSKGPGLAEVLQGEVELRDAVRAGPVSGVNVLSAGRLRGANAANLIELHFHKALGQIDNEVDLVLVVAAPLSECDDARIMSVGNALVLTVASGRVRPNALTALVEDLRSMRLRVVGSVLVRGAGRGRGYQP